MMMTTMMKMSFVDHSDVANYVIVNETSVAVLYLLSRCSFGLVSLILTQLVKLQEYC